MGLRRFKSGPVDVFIDADGMEYALRSAGAAAAARFVQQARRELAAVAEPYAFGDRWPKRTGLSSRSFGVVGKRAPDEVAVVLRNDARNRWGNYAYKVRWSVRTRDSLRDEVARVSARGRTPQARAAIARFWGSRLYRRHGEGSPSAQQAGRQPWREVRRQARPVADIVAETVRDAVGG